ncbi:MAG: DNA polymerase III subunit gamma/tau [Synergistaceae bacterium]|nr:DNA polymerase III subunit gamma/tau [Synergistaceae bacterium]
MSTALYRLYRPQKFKEVEGQTSAVDVLIKSISTGRAAHAYLFSGARGCGKTTVARLVAKALNCASPADNYEPCCECSNCVSTANGENLDVIEIDGASNNGVEEIRELKSHVSLAPFNSRFKVYIIDEVHMLSTAAFNALLKTLEEPPEYVVFILATTEPHKIPVTIRSRCQHIPFHRIRSSDILKRLEFVCEKENLEYENEALWEIARQADGALRDALSLLDQVMSFGKGKILLGDVSALVGGGSLPAIQRWLSEWRGGGENSFTPLDDMFQRGASPQRVIEELFYITRNLWIARAFGHECLAGADVSKEEYDYIVEEHKSWSADSLERLMLFLAKLLPQARTGMRADVIVGILLSRRGEIMGGENNSAAARPEVLFNKTAAKTNAEIKYETPVTKSAETHPSAENDPPKKEIKKTATADSKDNAAKISPRPAPSVISPFDPNDLEKEGFTPLGDEVRKKLLLNLKSNDFALFCALLDSELLHAPEPNKICVAAKHDYILHFLSGGRNYLMLTKILREEFPECKLKIICEGKSYENGGSDIQPRPKIQETPNLADDGPEPVEKIPVAEPLEAPQTSGRGSSLVYAAAHSAMKFMRGEIVMHRAAKDKAEEQDNS